MTTRGTAVAPQPASLSQMIGTEASTRPSEVVIIPLDDAGNADITVFGVLRFQYFPEAMQDSKTINYQQKEIPGASLPIYQWVASGERLITFTAQFSTDVDFLANPSIPATVAANGSGLQDRNVDIRSAVAWLRSFMFPRYISASSAGGGVTSQSGGSPTGVGAATSAGITYSTKPPRRLKLYIPNSGIGIAGGTASNAQTVFPDSVVCVMTQCEVNWEAYFPSGLPRMASVQLSFAQIAQLGTRVMFPSADHMPTFVSGTQAGSRFFGYRLPNRQREGSNTGVTVG